MPRAKNTKRTTGAGRPNSQAAQDSPAGTRDLVPSQDVPPGLARRPETRAVDEIPGGLARRAPARAGDEIPAGLTRRAPARAGDEIPAGLARRPETRAGDEIPAGLARRPGARAAGEAAAKAKANAEARAVGEAAGRLGAKAGAEARAVSEVAGSRAGAVGAATGGTAARAAGGTAAGSGAGGVRGSGDGGDDVPGWAARALQELLTVTYWLDPGQTGERFSATIRFTGHRTDVAGMSRPGDAFSVDETVDGIVPGSGPVAITAEVRDINPGSWAVTARPVTKGERTGAATAGRVPWPRRVPVPQGPGATVRTATILRSKVPGVIRYAYACLVALGVLTGLAIEALLLRGAHYPLPRPMTFSVAAVAAGVIGGKTWYAAVHRAKKWDGWCIQGFVAGAAVVVAAVAVAGPGLPAGAFLAAATPALLIGMGIGRHGCFWAGCCTGRPTASGWGIWSSDRRVGCRRMPVQLLEAWTALAAGSGALATVLIAGLHRSGPVAVAGLAAYTLVRQLILGLRDEPRQSRHGRPVTAIAAAIALMAGVALFAVTT